MAYRGHVDSLIGTQIGNYVVQHKLGEGGMGAVFMAEHPRIGHQVAIKVLTMEVGGHIKAATRFESEAKVIARLDHPNIIKFQDYGKLEGGSLYYVMELLRGRELLDVIQNHGKFTAEQALPYVEQICAALHEAHEHGVVHRDLKPENVIVLDRDPMTLKVLDFGIAKLLETDKSESITATGFVMGTPLYLAPEQGAGQPHRIGPHTDIYSLGVILYAMLGGRPPFVDDAPGMVVAMHIKDPPPPLLELEPTLQPAIARLIHRCLEKAPESRPPSARAVHEAYRCALNGEAAGDDPEVRGLLELMQDQPSSPAQPHLLDNDDGTLGGVGTKRMPLKQEVDRLLEGESFDLDEETGGQPAGGSGRRWLVLAALVVALALGGLAVAKLAGPQGPPSTAGAEVKPKPQAAPEPAPVKAPAAAPAAEPDQGVAADQGAAPPDAGASPDRRIKKRRPARKPKPREEAPAPETPAPKPPESIGEGTMEVEL